MENDWDFSKVSTTDWIIAGASAVIGTALGGAGAVAKGGKLIKYGARYADDAAKLGGRAAKMIAHHGDELIMAGKYLMKSGLKDVGKDLVEGIVIGLMFEGVSLGIRHREAIGDWTSNAASDVADWTSTAAEDVWDWTSEAATDTWDAMGEAADAVGDFLTDLFVPDPGSWIPSGFF
jgi:hypothetical protein